MTKTPSPSHRRAHPTRRDGTNDNQKKSGRGNKDDKDDDAIIQITNTPTPAKWPGHYICLVLDCDKQSQSHTDGYCRLHYNRIKKMKKGRIEVVEETPTKNNIAADSKRKRRRKNVDSDEDGSESGSTNNKKSQQKRRRQQKQREQQLVATTTKKETRNRKQLKHHRSPKRRIKSRPVYTELDDSEFEDDDDDDDDDEEEEEDTDDAITATTLNSRRRKNTKWRPSSEQQLLQQKRKYNRRGMRMLRGQEYSDDDDDIEVLEDTEDDDEEEVVFISSSPGRSRRSNNRTNGNNSRRNSTSSRQGQQVKKRKLDSSSTPPVKKMRHNSDSTHTMTARGNNNSSRRRGKSTGDDDGDDGNLPPFDIKPSESLLLSSKKEGGTGRLRLRNKNNTERILLERTRHELLTGRDYWICTTCIKSVPSLTLTCEHCNQLISFVPLTMNEFMRFVHRQRSIGNKSYTTTTTLARDEEVDKSSMAMSMGVEFQTEQEQTSQLETADAEMKSLKSEVSSFTNLQIQKEQGFIMEQTSPIVTSIPEEQSNIITEGSVVVVQSRTWIGINRLGGVGRVIKVHNTAAGNETNNATNKYDVAYVLGGRESNVDASFVTLYIDTD